MIAAEHLHQSILEPVNVLELVDHDVLQPLLPLEPDSLIFLEDMEGEFDQVVVVQPKALSLLVEVAVKDHIPGLYRVQIPLLQSVQRQTKHVPVILRFLEQLADFDHIPRRPEGHIPEAEAPLLIDHLQHGVNVCVVQYQKALWIPHHVAVLLEHGDAEAVKGVNVARVVVPGQPMDALTHLRGRLVGEGHAQDIPRQDTQLIDQERKPMGQGAGLAGARPGDHPNKAFGRRDRLPLRLIQPLQQILHDTAS